MKNILIVLFALGSMSSFAQELNRKVEKISSECSKDWGKRLKIGKIKFCDAELVSKAPLNHSVFCVGKSSDKKSTCKITLSENVLKSECQSKWGDRWAVSNGVATVDFYKPIIDVVGSRRRTLFERTNVTVISAETKQVSLVVIHEDKVVTKKFKSNAMITMNNSSLKNKELLDVDCYVLD